MTLFRILSTNDEANNKLKGLCFIAGETLVGKSMKILYYDESAKTVKVWQTSAIKNAKLESEKMLVVETDNSKYFISPFHNSVHDEIVEGLVLNGVLHRKAEAVAEKYREMKPYEILTWIHNLRNKSSIETK